MEANLLWIAVLLAALQSTSPAKIPLPHAPPSHSAPADSERVRFHRYPVDTPVEDVMRGEGLDERAYFVSDRRSPIENRIVTYLQSETAIFGQPCLVRHYFIEGAYHSVVYRFLPSDDDAADFFLRLRDELIAQLGEPEKDLLSWGGGKSTDSAKGSFSETFRQIRDGTCSRVVWWPTDPGHCMLWLRAGNTIDPIDANDQSLTIRLEFYAFDI